MVAAKWHDMPKRTLVRLKEIVFSHYTLTTVLYATHTGLLHNAVLDQLNTGFGLYILKSWLFVM